MTATVPSPPRLLLPVAIFTGIILGTCVFLTAKVLRPPPVDPMSVEYWEVLGQTVPEVQLVALDGREVSSHLYQGQAHLLFFAEAGCPICDEVYPALKQANTSLPVLMVAAYGLETMRLKATEQGFTFPVVYDTLAVLTDPLQVKGFPAAMWVNAEERIIKAAGGSQMSAEVIRQAVASLSPKTLP